MRFDIMDVLNPNNERTAKGQFGWEAIGNIYMPYIFRGAAKYCAVRMVEMFTIQGYQHVLNEEVFNCISVQSYYVTTAEACLLNEINVMHCDCLFGRSQFTTVDRLIRLKDAAELRNFLNACATANAQAPNRCGFVQINKHCVPYAVHKNERMMPLFYFEGDMSGLLPHCVKLEGWDLIYLKFCCKLVNIRNNLVTESCLVASFQRIKTFFPPETVYVHWWPRTFFKPALPYWRSKPVQWTRPPVENPETQPCEVSTKQKSIAPTKDNKTVEKQENQAQQENKAPSQQDNRAPTNQDNRAPTNQDNRAPKKTEVLLPYRITTSYIEGIRFQSINRAPNVYDELLVNLHDVVKVFFKNKFYVQLKYMLTTKRGQR